MHFHLKLFLFLLVLSLKPVVYTQAQTSDSRLKNTSAKANSDPFGLDLPATGSKWLYPTGTVIASVGTSLGVIGYPSWGSRSAFLPILIQAEYSFDPHWSAGGYLGFYSIRYSEHYGPESYSSRLSSTILGGKLTFHGTDILNELLDVDMDLRKIDLYSSFSAGLVSRKWKVDQHYESTRNWSRQVYPSLGLVLGARYFFVPGFSVYGEIGKGQFGFFTFGGAWKLR